MLGAMAEDGGDFTVVSDSLKLRAFDVEFEVVVLVDVEFDVDSVTMVWATAEVIVKANAMPAQSFFVIIVV